MFIQALPPIFTRTGPLPLTTIERTLKLSIKVRKYPHRYSIPFPIPFLGPLLDLSPTRSHGGLLGEVFIPLDSEVGTSGDYFPVHVSCIDACEGTSPFSHDEFT